MEKYLTIRSLKLIQDVEIGEELIGKNSEIPWTKDKTKISIRLEIIIFLGNLYIL